MKIKKFTCNSCGAPKVNAYKSPYIMCDFCGNFCDIDYKMGYEAWSADPKRTKKYQKEEKKILSDLASYKDAGMKKEYYQTQEKYWDIYYKAFPEYLPPTIDPEKPAYKEYIFICADYSTMAAFDPGQPMVNKVLHQYQANMEYDVINGETKVKSDGFFKYINYYIEYMKESFISFYNTPEYGLMHQVLPHDTHLKMKLSAIVQNWLPLLSESDVKQFLEQTGFKEDYIEIPLINKEQKDCVYCKALISVPEHSLRVHCENCHKTNLIRNNFNCISCGTENDIPELPVNTIECNSCGVENKLITPLFS